MNISWQQLKAEKRRDFLNVKLWKIVRFWKSFKILIISLVLGKNILSKTKFFKFSREIEREKIVENFWMTAFLAKITKIVKLKLPSKLIFQLIFH